jgi:hypothetical protein
VRVARIETEKRTRAQQCEEKNRFEREAHGREAEHSRIDRITLAEERDALGMKKVELDRQIEPGDRRSLDRRAFLAGSGAIVAALAAPALASLFGCDRRPTLAQALVGFYSDPASAARIGRAVLAAVPAEATAEAVVAALAGDRRAELEALAASDPGALRALLQKQHRSDFEDGRTVSIDGWVLSRTEARLCAVAALAGRAG